MKKLNGLTLILLSMIVMLTSSCSAIMDIFQAGMGVGIFLVIAVCVIIAFVVMKLRKK